MKTLIRLFIAIGVLSTGLTAADYNRVPAGQIKGARLAYVSTNSIKIGVGYGEVSGSYWEIGPTDTLVTTGYTLTGLSATTNGVFHYIYIDRANSSFPEVAIRNSTTAPAWSDSFMGWYDGADRCIGAVWIKADGNIRDFLCSDDETYYVNQLLLLTASSVSTTTNVFSTLDINPYSPVNASSVYFSIEAFGSWTRCTVQIAREATVLPYSNVQESGVTNCRAADWVAFERGADRKIRWSAFGSSASGTMRRFVEGYRIER